MAELSTESGATCLFAGNALTPQGWKQNILIRWDDAGVITAVDPCTKPPEDTEKIRCLIPGMVNIHSHAFQRGFAGLSEYRNNEQDSFWSWRQLMYDFANTITPKEFETIATFLYGEMIAAGYTSVCEFHYLHHAPDGSCYNDPAAMSRCLIHAADRAGIGLTLLPVFYRYAGFNRRAAETHQRRFLQTPEAMLALWQELHKTLEGTRHCVGIAPHSLRAVVPEEVRDLLAEIRRINVAAPVHIHVAEQVQEVNDCLTAHGRRPVQWLMEQLEVDHRWCLIHATHMTDAEYRLVAESGAVVGLCPTTEANLGDGIFELERFRKYGGRWGIGSDSNTVVDPAEELMLLEYGQRLMLQQRNVYVTSAKETAQSLYLDALAGAAQASGRPCAGITVGQSADLVELDVRHPAMAGLDVQKIIAGQIFASSRTSAVGRVWTAGVLRAINRENTESMKRKRAPETESFCEIRRNLIAGRKGEENG